MVHGIYTQGRGPKSCKAWSCVGAWKHRRKTVFSTHVHAYKWSPWWHLHIQCEAEGALPQTPRFCGQVRMLQQGQRGNCSHQVIPVSHC